MIKKEQLQPYGNSGPIPLYAAATEDRLFGWEQAVRVVRKNRRFIFLLASVLIASVVLVAFLMRDIFQPAARVQIDPPNHEISTLQEIEGTKIASDQDYLETQAQILQSEALAMRVIRHLRLDRNADFVSKADQERFGKEEARSSSSATAVTRPNAFLQEQTALADQTPLESIALGVFQKRLSVTPVRNSRLIEVSYASHDPEVAQLVTNSLIEQFIEQSFHDRYTSTMESSGWLSSKLDEMRAKVERSNRAVSDYQRKFGLVESDEHDVPLGQLMSEVNHQLSEAQANRIESEAYVRMIDAGQPESIPAVRDNPLYQTLMTRLGDARAQLAQAQAVYGDENSNVKKLQSEAHELAAQVEAERGRMVSRVRTSFGAAQSREQMMLGSREKLRSQMGDVSSHLVAYRMLKNEAMANAELYNTLQGRLKEAGIYAGLRTSNIHVVNLAAKLRKATAPHRGVIIGAGAMLSCLFAMTLAFVRESFDNTVRTPDDIKEWIGLPTLALIPHRKSDLEWNQNQTDDGEAMRELRAALCFSAGGVAPRVILVASGSAGEGRTSVATNLAMTLAKNGKTCLLDADLRKPLTTDFDGASNSSGLSQVLTGAITLDRALSRSGGAANFRILDGGAGQSNPGELIDSERMKSVVASLRKEFDYVVIDTPPAIPFSDARVVATYADAAVLVARYGRTTRRSLLRCAELLGRVGVAIAGVALNDIDPASEDFRYYNYGYNFHVAEKNQIPGQGKMELFSDAEFSETEKKKSAHA